MASEFWRVAFRWPPSALNCKIIVVQSILMNLLMLGSAIYACATPPQATAPAPQPQAEQIDAGSAIVPVPACTESNLRQRIAVADGSVLWCVPVEGSDRPEWVTVR